MDNGFQYAQGRRIELTEKQKREIRKMYKDVLDEVKELSEHYKGRQETDAAAKRQQLREVKKQVQKAIDRLSAEIEGTIQEGMEEAAQYVVEDNNAMVHNMGFTVRSSYMYVPTMVVESVASGQLYKGRWTLSSAIWGDNKKTISDINKVIAKGIAEGKSTYEITKDLEKYVNPNKRKSYDWGRIYPGTKKVVDYNALRLASTMINHSYQEAFVRVTKNNPFVESYRWLTANNDRVCPICKERAEHDSGLGAGIYRKDELPLDHPNGQCTFVAVITGSYMDISNKLADHALGMGDPELNRKIDSFIEDMKTF